MTPSIKIKAEVQTDTDTMSCKLQRGTEEELHWVERRKTLLVLAAVIKLNVKSVQLGFGRIHWRLLFLIARLASQILEHGGSCSFIFLRRY